jgi:drug/metabolite transporter (DMT)-like permease
MTPSHRRGLLLVAGAAFVWSLGGLMFRLIAADVMTIVCGRALAAAVFLLIILGLKTRGHPIAAIAGLGLPGFAVAILFAVDSSFYMSALHFTTVAHVVVMMSLTPLFAALAAWLVMREAIRSYVAVAMLLAFAGVALMVSGNFGGGAWVGDGLALGVPTLFAVITVITRRNPGIDLLPAVCLAGVLSGLAFLPFAHFGGLAAKDLGLLTLLGLIEFGLGLLLYLSGAKLLPAAEATLMSLLETVVAPIWVWIFVAENPGWRAIAGGAIVLTALLALTLADMRRTPVAA